MNTLHTESFHTPIAFLIFNRPATTKRVFEEIREARPTKLLVVADGPRNEDERRLCEDARAIIETIDWPCEVLKDYSDFNLGCRKRVSSGISWVFQNVERAIILEDDCLPHPTFFRYCAELLERYKDDPEIMHISGDNFHSKNKGFRCDDSYYFSNIPHIWGWASWRRAWKTYDVSLKNWPDVKRQRLLMEVFGDEPTAARWEDKFQDYYDGKIDSWDGQWAYASLVNRGLSIMPKVNLISNIGFGKDSTHTHEDAAQNALAALPTLPMDFPLSHPKEKKLNVQAVDYLSDYIFGIYKYRAAGSRLKRLIKRTLPGLYESLKRAR
jgi:hypothetical protein